MANEITPRLKPTPTNPRQNNNLTSARAPFLGKQIQAQGNIPTILKNPAWSSEKV